MLNLLVAYTTHDGHTPKIAERTDSALRENDCAVEVCDLARSLLERPSHEYDGAIAGGPLHGGKHPPQVAKLASENREVLNHRRSAFFPVSLSAAGNEGQRGDATRSLFELLDATCWQPVATSILAGVLLCRKHGFFKRWMIRMIVKRGGTSDTDTSRNYVYTDWDSVDRFANEFAGQLTGRAFGRATSTIA